MDYTLSTLAAMLSMGRSLKKPIPLLLAVLWAVWLAFLVYLLMRRRICAALLW